LPGVYFQGVFDTRASALSEIEIMRKLNLVLAWIVLSLGVVIAAKTLAAGSGVKLSTGIVFGGALITVGIARMLMYRRRPKN